ncbi:DUF2490 domain-containing protein [Tamlana crocina]|uniref:DUF2490 domain-containing protein n=1 Tax=Tamlana crocina TaxID=393006 RepID=A0ABX1D6F1_9FLAO|nr:DUF2490 domain-containing protein [Tamlana crocina]NJX13884.1 DUF2490 domain-containing protein [Tamlana crocina]
MFPLSVLCQDGYSTFFEPEVNFEYKVGSNYTQEFSLENRNLIYSDNNFIYTVKHLEIAHASKIDLSERGTLGLGMQYRFEENFKNKEENEFRLAQEFTLGSPINKGIRYHNFAFEQRFYKLTTKYRFRYQLGVEKPLSANRFFIAETEALFEVAATQKPELEQRLSTVLGFSINSKTNFTLGMEYRLANYNLTLAHELFLITALDIEL